MTANPGLTLTELLQGEHGASSDQIYILIAAEHLYVDVRSAPLAEPEQVHVFRDEEIARAYALITGTTCKGPTPEMRCMAMSVGSPIVWDQRPWTDRTTI